MLASAFMLAETCFQPRSAARSGSTASACRRNSQFDSTCYGLSLRLRAVKTRQFRQLPLIRRLRFGFNLWLERFVWTGRIGDIEFIFRPLAVTTNTTT